MTSKAIRQFRKKYLYGRRQTRTPYVGIQLRLEFTTNLPMLATLFSMADRLVEHIDHPSVHDAAIFAAPRERRQISTAKENIAQLFSQIHKPAKYPSM
jgi:hypothetical protein